MCRVLYALFAVSLLCHPLARQQSQSFSGNGLEIRYGKAGLEQLSYGGQLLEDTARWPEDHFHIWHMLCLDGQGKARSDGQYGWGENNQGKSWDLATHSWTYRFTWGSIRVHYEQHRDTLRVDVSATNFAGSGIVFDGATIYPVGLHPAGEPIIPPLANDVTAPGVSVLNWGYAEVAVVVPAADNVLYSGFVPGTNGASDVLVSGTRPDSLPASAGHGGRPIKPGQTDTYSMMLRFAPGETSTAVLAQDAYREWTSRWPETLHWLDRRIIGTVFLASSPQGDKTRPGGYPTNPRRYFTDEQVDIVSEAGRQRFQIRVLAQAQTVVANLKRLNAQGAITWDIEGEQYPQDTSYVCAPDQIARAAPEMEALVAVRGSRYTGMRLDDAYFTIIRDAGFRVGVCVRPQRLSFGGDGSARQQSLPDAEVAAELIRKMRFAHDRWGATLFYLDSTVRADGTTLDPAILEEAATAMPDSLLIPEESSPRLYRATAPFKTFLFHGDLGTSDKVKSYVPNAFSANLVNDVAPAQLALHHGELVEAVRGGDILMVLANYWQANDATVLEIYQSAARK